MRKEITDLLIKEEFMEKIINMETPTEVKEAFKKENIDITDKELKEVGGNIYFLINQISKSHELSNDEMEKISGGVFITVGAALGLAGALGNMARSYFDLQGRNAAAAEAMANLKTKEIETSFKGIISQNPGYAALSTVALTVGAVYIAKIFVDSIRDGSLKRWFKSSEQ